MGVSELYQAQYHIDDYNDLSYNWGNDAHPETYQSFVTTGKGLIDQSIFPFQRRRDAWSLGAHCTQFYCNDDPDHMPAMIITDNRNTKNNAFVTSFATVAGSTLYSKYIIEHCKYSPNPTMGGYAPWINFCYNKLTIVPVFGVVNSSTGQYNTTDYTYNELVDRGMENWRVNSIVLEYYGAPSGWQYNPLTIQFAGNLYPEQWQSMGGNDYKLRVDTTMDSGVYYVELPTILFNGYSVTQNDIIVNRTAETITSFFDYSQMDTEMTRRSDGTYRFTISMADAIKIMNSLGFYWGKSRSAANSPKGINCTDPDVVCPVIDSETHMVTETVLSGTEIADYAEDHIDDPFCNFLLDYGNLDENDNPIGYTTEEYRENYNPEQSTVEETETIELYPPTVATTGGNTIWLMSETDVKNFFTYLWDPTGSEVTNIIQGLALLGENPMDFIVSLRMFPLKNLYNLTTHALATICFGRYTSQLTNQAYLTSSNIIIVDLGEFYFNDGGLKNDFRDYEPYTRYSLFIPFCGITSLNAIECINQTIDVKMIIDLATGACTAVVYTDGVPYKYIDSNIGLEIPVVGRDMAGYSQTVMAAALGGGIGGGKLAEKPVKGQLERQNIAKDYQQISYDAKMWDVGDSFGATAGAAGGTAVALGAAGIVGGALLSGTVAALQTAPAIDKVGSSVPAVSIAEPLYCYFIVQRSDCWIPQNYEKLYGRPLNEGGTVGDFVGFSTFGNLKLDGIAGATPEEKLLINDLLQSGVYI